MPSTFSHSVSLVQDGKICFSTVFLNNNIHEISSSRKQKSRKRKIIKFKFIDSAINVFHVNFCTIRVGYTQHSQNSSFFIGFSFF